MFELKVDQMFPHHYLFSVGLKDMFSENPGQMFLKHGPIYFTNIDVEKVKDALILSQDAIYRKFYKLTSAEILEVTECRELINTVSMFKMSAMANNCSIHHFSTEHLIHDYETFFIQYVKLANHNSDIRRKIHESKQHARG